MSRRDNWREDFINEVVEELGIQDEQLKNKLRDKLREKLDELHYREESDAEEVSKILAAVSPFLENLFTWLGSGLRDIFNFIQSSYDGKKLGEDIGQLYQALKAQGLPDDMVKDMVKEYYYSRLKALPAWGDLLERLTQLIMQRTASQGIRVDEREKQ